MPIKYVGEDSIKRVISDTKALLAGKVDKVNGKGLSTNDYTNEEKTKLASLDVAGEANVIEIVKVNGDALTPDANKAVDVTVPTNTNQLTNGAGFITNAVNDLANYYKKTETYTQSEVNTLIGNITTISAEVVATLPTASATTYFNTSKTIYLKRNSASSGTDYYEEYITLRDGAEGSYTYSWEKIGDTQIDLSGYVQTSRKVNNKALTSDITLDASDVGALPSNTTYVSSVNGSSGAITDIATTSQVNAKYTKPSGGIPKTDLASAVQTSLGKADSALQSISSSNVTTALGFTPYNATNPSGYTKVEASSTNGNIKVNNTETVVYTLPNTVLEDSDLVEITTSEVDAWFNS